MHNEGLDFLVLQSPDPWRQALLGHWPQADELPRLHAVALSPSSRQESMIDDSQDLFGLMSGPVRPRSPLGQYGPQTHTGGFVDCYSSQALPPGCILWQPWPPCGRMRLRAGWCGEFQPRDAFVSGIFSGTLPRGPVDKAGDAFCSCAQLRCT